MAQLSHEKRAEIRQRVEKGELVIPDGADERAATAPVTDEQIDVAIAFVEENPGCSVRQACDAAGMKRWQFRALQANDPEFAVRYAEARGYGPDHIRQELHRRAIVGVPEDVWHNGEVVGTRIVVSDRLLALMAKANLPEYRDASRVEVSGPGGGPVVVEDRSASLDDVFAVLVSAGAVDASRISGGPAQGAVPGAPPVLAAPSDG